MRNSSLLVFRALFALAISPLFIDSSPFTIDPMKGALTLQGVSSCGNFPIALAGDPSGKFLYVAKSTGDVCSFEVNSATGGISPIGSRVTAGDTPASINVGPSGKYLFVANSGSDNISVFAIDPNSGTLTSAGTPTHQLE